MIESVLSRGYSKRDVIDSRKSPRVPNPVWQKRHDRRGLVRFRQRCAITKGDFHLRRWQWAGKLLRDCAIRTVGAHQMPALKLFAILRSDNPIYCVLRCFGSLNTSAGNLRGKY